MLFDINPNYFEEFIDQEIVELRNLYWLPYINWLGNWLNKYMNIHKNKWMLQ